MSRNLNWKAGGLNSIEAWASRAVAGKYLIECRQDSDPFHHLHPNGPISFQVSRYTTSGDGQWDCDKDLHAVSTLSEAIAIAEADNQRRLEATKERVRS
jgi:hypothetical protein